MAPPIWPITRQFANRSGGGKGGLWKWGGTGKRRGGKVNLPHWKPPKEDQKKTRHKNHSKGKKRGGRPKSGEKKKKIAGIS